MKAAFNDLFQSRKFWIAVCDAAFSVVIGSITAQNVAGIKAEASVKSAGLYLEQPK